MKRYSFLLALAAFVLLCGILVVVRMRLRQETREFTGDDVLRFPLPNREGGTPAQQNFYMIDPLYSRYLVAQFDVSESPYDSNKEPEWIADSVSQIRSKGQDRFPPVSFITIAIFNRAEHNGEETFVPAHKAAVIAPASEVFDSTKSVDEIVAHLQLDRHPFELDGERQRWLIVERHVAAHPYKQPRK